MKFMYWKVVCIVCITIMVALSPSLGWGAFIMKTDGSVMNVSFDPQQAIHISTSIGKVTVKLADIEWMASEKLKRIRIKSEPKLIVGEIMESEVAVREEGDNYQLIPNDILFFYKNNVDFKTIGAIEIFEHSSGQLDFRQFKKSSPNDEFMIRLMPNNWSGSLTISDAVYPSIISSRSDFYIGINLLSGYSEQLELLKSVPSDSYLQHVWLMIEGEKERRILSRSYPLIIEDSQDPAKSRANSILGTLSFLASASELSNEGIIYTFISSKKRQLLVYGNRNLIIHSTDSNILKLPILIKEEFPLE